MIYQRHNIRKEELEKQKRIQSDRDIQLKAAKVLKQNYHTETFQTPNFSRHSCTCGSQRNSQPGSLFDTTQQPEAQARLSNQIRQSNANQGPLKADNIFNPHNRCQTYHQTPSDIGPSYFIHQRPPNQQGPAPNGHTSRRTSEDSQNQYMSTISMGKHNGRHSRNTQDSGVQYLVSERTSFKNQAGLDGSLTFKSPNSQHQNYLAPPYQNLTNPHNRFRQGSNTAQYPKINVNYPRNSNTQNQNLYYQQGNFSTPNQHLLKTQQDPGSHHTIRTLAEGSQNFFINKKSIQNQLASNHLKKPNQFDDPYAFQENTNRAGNKILNQPFQKVNLNPSSNIFLQNGKCQDFTRRTETVERTSSSEKRYDNLGRIKLSNQALKNSYKIKSPNDFQNLNPSGKPTENRTSGFKPSNLAQSKPYTDRTRNSLHQRTKTQTIDPSRNFSPNVNPEIKKHFPPKLLKNVRVSKNGKVYRTDKSPVRKIGINQFDKVVRKRGRLGFGIKGRVSANSRGKSVPSQTRNSAAR